MQWIKYQIVQSEVNEEVILVTKKIGYSEANLVIAEAEAYNGEYTIEEDTEESDVKPIAIELGGTGCKTVEEVKDLLGIVAMLNSLTSLSEEVTSIPNIVYATEEPTEVPENTIVMVYEG